MKKTPNLNLPVYDTPNVDTFKVEDWNNANENIDYVFGELKSNPNVNAIDITARQGVVENKTQLEDVVNKKLKGVVNIYEYVGLATKISGSEILDWTNAIKQAYTEYRDIEFPSGIYGISDTIILNQFMSLKGSRMSSIEKSTVFKWVGTKQDKKTMFLLGKNEVGAEPTNDCSDIFFKNCYIDGNNNIGFGVYGTYLTNDTCVQNVTVINTLQHAFYFAKAWYAKIENLLAKDNMGCGISLGMPLRYNDNTTTTWTSPSPLEMNNVYCRDLRAIRSGKDKKFNYTTNRMWGYGIGCGNGNGFRLSSFISEYSDGVGIYCYVGSQPQHTIEKGYLEYNCISAVSEGRSPKSYTITYELTSTNTRGVKAQDIFISGNNNEGISQVGLTSNAEGKIQLKNISYGKFLESSAPDVFICEKCNYDLMALNSFENSYGVNCFEKELNIRYSSVTRIPHLFGRRHQLYIYSPVAINLSGTTVLTMRNWDGTTTNVNLPTTIQANTLTKLVNEINPNIKDIFFGGTQPTTDTPIEFIIYRYTGYPTY